MLELLDRLCRYHHRLKTTKGWALVEGSGKRDFVPPEDPRHRRFGMGPQGPGASAGDGGEVAGVDGGVGAGGDNAGVGGNSAERAAGASPGQPPGGRYVDATRAASSISVAVTSTTVRTLAAPLALTASAAPAALMLSG
jgi:hypothetical protein